MRKLLVGSCAPLAIAMAVIVAACGKASAPGSPSPPSGSGAPSVPSGSVTGATIAGTVMSAPTVSSLSALGTTMTVSIVGTAISATIDASGRFTLQNVPSGDITLAFTGNGIDARITITRVGTNDQIRISVRLNGNVVDVDQNEHEMANDEAEIEGRVASTNCGVNPQTIVIGTMTPTTVDVQNARIRHGGTTLTCAQIRVNDRVEAHGTKTSTTIVATAVNVETEHGLEQEPNDDHDDEANEAEVQGTVAGAPAGHSCPAFTFAVGSTSVSTNGATRFEDTTCAEVVNGVTVEAKGTRTGPNAIMAIRVEKK